MHSRQDGHRARTDQGCDLERCREHHRHHRPHVPQGSRLGVALATADGSEFERNFWRFSVEGAVKYSNVFLIDEGVLDLVPAVAVWIPPGGEEMSESQDAALRRLVADRLPP
jgi:hypothetical protein